MYVNESVFADFTDITLVSNDTYQRLWQVRILMTTITMMTTMNMHAWWIIKYDHNEHDDQDNREKEQKFVTFCLWQFLSWFWKQKWRCFGAFKTNSHWCPDVPLACAVEEGYTPFQLCLVWDDKVRGMVGLGMYWLGIIVCFGIVWFNTI